MDSPVSGPMARLRMRLAWVMLACAAGCTEYRGPVSMNSDDPDLKILAIKDAEASRNSKDAPTLVQNLNDDDSAIRFYSIQALHKITHDDFGYHYYENEDQRAPAVARWQNWLKQQTASAR